MFPSTNNNTFESMNQASSSHYVTSNNVTSFDRQFLHWSFIVLEVAAILTIVVGDVSMLMLFFTRKLLGQATNILVFSVAIGDLVNGMLTFPLAMLQKILLEPSEFLCKGYFYFANVSKTAVAYTILLLAMERIAAVLNCTYRILPPGRCLFFASLTWFFSAAYNIWSVVIYDMEIVNVITRHSTLARQQRFSICFASRRFMYLHGIFEFLNPLVTFCFPVVSSSLLFLGFWLDSRHAGNKPPGRPYKSSKSVVIFTFALLISFLATHFPWEIANLVFVHDAPTHTVRELIVLKVLHIVTFSRGFWDIFIFGAFRRYVCKKEKALAHFREQRSLQVQRSSLSIPITEQPASLSLLDSDPSVSRRYSSDVTISRRPSAMDGISVYDGEEHQNNHATSSESQGLPLVDFPQRRKSTTITTTIISDNYLIPRSPCLHEHSRRFSFVPPTNTTPFPPPKFPRTIDECGIPKTRNKSKNGTTRNIQNCTETDNKTSPESAILTSPEMEEEDDGITLSHDSQKIPATTKLPSITISGNTSQPLLPSSIPPSLSSPSSSLLSSVPLPPSIMVASTSTNCTTTATLHVDTTHAPLPSSSSSSSSLPSHQKSYRSHSLEGSERKRKKYCTFKDADILNDSNTVAVGNSHQNVASHTERMETGRKLSLFLETTFDLTLTSPTTIAAVTRDDINTALTLCENDL